MLIKSLKMENFRQFKGTTAVTFSCDPDKNVTIILGDNTFGKIDRIQANAIRESTFTYRFNRVRERNRD